MSAKLGAIAGGVMLLMLAACSRAPPAQGPVGQASESFSETGAEAVVLAGAPPASSMPATETYETTAQPVEALAPRAEPATAAPSPSDPLEPVNRQIYAVDRVVGRAIQKRPKLPSMAEPRAQAAAHAVRNALHNLDEPGIAANDLLQRKLARAGRTAVRFLINSTIGVAGLVDVAKRLGIRRHENDLDRTLASYGAPAGPYLYLPVAGPATLRAVVAAAAEGYLYPPHWFHLAAGVGAALKGAGYAKLADKVVRRADGAPGETPGPDDAYAHTRNAYYASKVAPSSARPITGGGKRRTELASVLEQDE